MSVGSAIGTRVLGDRDRVCYWDILSGRSSWDLQCKIWNCSGDLGFWAGITIIENANASRFNAPPTVPRVGPLEAKSKEPSRQRSWRRVVVFMINAITAWILSWCCAVFVIKYKIANSVNTTTQARILANLDFPNSFIGKSLRPNRVISACLAEVIVFNVRQCSILVPEYQLKARNYRVAVGLAPHGELVEIVTRLVAVRLKVICDSIIVIWSTTRYLILRQRSGLVHKKQ